MVKPAADDLLSETGAVALAERLAKWWHMRGYPQAEFRAVARKSKNGKEIWTVRSNLVNGLPPGWKGPTRKVNLGPRARAVVR